MADNVRRKPGVNLLIFLYAFLIYRNLMDLAKTGNNVIFSLVFIATLVYLIFGFIKRIMISRIIAVVFHSVYEAVILFPFFAMCNTSFLKQSIKDISSGMIIFAKLLFVFIFIGITVANVMAIVYLMRNREYFLKK